MLTFAQVRQCLGFGVVRLKMLKVIKEHPELDKEGWDGEVVLKVTREHRGRVFHDVHEGPREVTLDALDS